jgi:hypothetical protein
MTLVGGLGTVFGPVVGAFVIIAMQQYLAGFGQWATVIQGVIFVVCVLTFRDLGRENIPQRFCGHHVDHPFVHLALQVDAPRGFIGSQSVCRNCAAG